MPLLQASSLSDDVLHEVSAPPPATARCPRRPPSAVPQIWEVADPEGSGFLDEEGFRIALRLASLAQQGYDVDYGNIELSDLPVNLGHLTEDFLAEPESPRSGPSPVAQAAGAAVEAVEPAPTKAMAAAPVAAHVAAVPAEGVGAGVRR